MSTLKGYDFDEKEIKPRLFREISSDILDEALIPELRMPYN